MSARRRSLWGWGWADRFPDDAVRTELGRQAAARLGLGTLELRTPPTAESVRLPPPRVRLHITNEN